MDDVTKILEELTTGRARSEDLLPLVYEELRELAAARLRQESAGNTLQATALVHEAYLKMIGSRDLGWDSRGHFFAAAAESMRRILIDRARKKKRVRHGGDRERVDLQNLTLSLEAPADELLNLDEALQRFESEDSVKANLVKLRFFAGLTGEQAAAALGISRATADRYWAYARAWLYHEMTV